MPQNGTICLKDDKVIWEYQIDEFLFNANTFFETNSFQAQPMYNFWEIGNSDDQPVRTEYVYINADCEEIIDKAAREVAMHRYQIELDSIMYSVLNRNARCMAILLCKNAPNWKDYK